MEDLKNIILEIKSYGLKCSDDMILDCATRIFNSGNIEKKKIDIQEQKLLEKATLKQINYLKRLNYKGNLEISKIEAKKLIEDILNATKKAV